MKQIPSQGVGIGKPPAAFRRLCVETTVGEIVNFLAIAQPPSGGCVLKHDEVQAAKNNKKPSRLQAAVC